jgi:hypothetical protein
MHYSRSSEDSRSQEYPGGVLPGEGPLAGLIPPAREPGGPVSRFFRRLEGTLLDDLLPQPDDVEQRYSAVQDAFLRIFGTTPDVPVSAGSLAGFILGVMYSHRYVPTTARCLRPS